MAMIFLMKPTNGSRPCLCLPGSKVALASCYRPVCRTNASARDGNKADAQLANLAGEDRKLMVLMKACTHRPVAGRLF